MSGENNNPSVNRRTLLRGLSAGTASIVGMSGMAASSAGSHAQTEPGRSWEMERAAEAFTTDGAVERLLLDKGAPVRETFESEGISLDLAYEEFDEMRTFPDERDGTPTAHIVAEREDDARTVEFHVLPQVNEAFAFEKTDSGLRRFESDDVRPAEFCETDTYCDGYCNPYATKPCGHQYADGIKVKERCCKYSDGSTSCEKVSEECTDDCPGYSC